MSRRRSRRGAVLDPQVPVHEVSHQGASRRYLSWQPPAPAAGRAPIVLLLHGQGGSSDGLFGARRVPSPYASWIPIARREGLILLAPDGLPGVPSRS